MDLNSLLQEVIDSKSPDLHLQVGQPPVVRLKNGDIAALTGYKPLGKEQIESVINEIANPAHKKRLEKELEVDFSHALKGQGRFRVNVFYEQNGPSVAFRMIGEEIPALEAIGLGEEAEALCQLPHGLVLVTGPTGMGKSTTLASMVDYINQNRNAHIITIEDPIEYVYESKNSLVTQREVSVHTRSFASAIKSALRQDPNVVMVGEMRDLETIAAAITLAETGHLVFSTLHTPDAAQTIDRIIDVFPAYQQQQVRAQLGTTLKGVIAQVLVPRADGEGRIAAREILLTNDAIRNCIVQGQIHQIYSMIQLNGSEGMRLMDQSLEQLAREGKITKEDALSKAHDIDTLFENLKTI